jgi:excisionase family DNA binding protein
MSAFQLAQPDEIKLADSVKPVVYVTPDIATKLQVSEKHIRRMVDANRIPGVIRLGRLVRFNASIIDDWIRAGCPKPKR